MFRQVFTHANIKKRLMKRHLTIAYTAAQSDWKIPYNFVNAEM